MRSVTMWCLVGASAIAGCGGAPEAGNGGAAAEQAAPASDGAASPAPQGATPATAGKTWEVRMLGDDKGYRFEPAALTIKTGDAVRFVNVSGPPHNVAFWADSIPTGASAPLQANMPTPAGPLTGPLLNALNETYTVSFTNAPAGPYGYYCTVHLGLGMVAKITVE